MTAGVGEPPAAERPRRHRTTSRPPLIGGRGARFPHDRRERTMPWPSGVGSGRWAIRAARIRALCVALLAVGTAGCARATNAASRDLSSTGAALIEVRNDQFDDCVIYLIRGGTPVALGVAPGLSHRTFRINPGLLGEGGGVVLGAGKRGGTIERVTSPFDLPQTRIASWVVRAGNRTEQPILR